MSKVPKNFNELKNIIDKHHNSVINSVILIVFIISFSLLVVYYVKLNNLQCPSQSSSQSTSQSLFRNSFFRPLRTLTNTVNYNIIYGGNGMVPVYGNTIKYLKGSPLWNNFQKPITNSNIDANAESGIFVVSSNGMYIVSAQLDFSASYSQFGFCVNGNEVFNGTNSTGDVPCNTGTIRSSINTILKLNNGDKVGLITWRFVSPERINTNSDTTWNCDMNVSAPGGYVSYFSICKIV